MGLFLRPSQSQLPNAVMEQQLQSVSSATMLGVYRAHFVTTSLESSEAWDELYLIPPKHHCKVYIRSVTSDQHKANFVLPKCCLPCPEPPCFYQYFLAWTQIPRDLLFCTSTSELSAQLAWPRQQREGNLFRAEEKTTFQIDLLKHLHSQLCRNFNTTWRTFGWNFAQLCTYP